MLTLAPWLAVDVATTPDAKPSADDEDEVADDGENAPELTSTMR
jgi:hypothetical protein